MSRFPHLHGCRLCVGRELLPDRCVMLAAREVAARHRFSARGYVADGTSSPSPCAPGVGFHGAPAISINTSLTHRSCSVFSLDRSGPDITCRRAAVHPFGSQPQSEKLHGETSLPACSLCFVSCPSESRTHIHRELVTLSGTACRGLS